jgi:hypothetical protein
MKIKWGVSTRVWWSYIWRSFVYAIIPGIVFSVLGNVFLPAMGHANWLGAYYVIVWYGMSIPISMVAMNHAIEVHHSRLAAIENSAVASVQPSAPGNSSSPPLAQ